MHAFYPIAQIMYEYVLDRIPFSIMGIKFIQIANIMCASVTHVLYMYVLSLPRQFHLSFANEVGSQFIEAFFGGNQKVF